MERRNFILSSSALVIGSLPGCGGGDDSSESSENYVDESIKKPLSALSDTSGSLSPIAKDEFSGVAGAGLGPNWTNQVPSMGNLVINTGGQVRGLWIAVSGSHDIAAAFWTGASNSPLTADQASELRLVNPAAYFGQAYRIGVTARASGVASARNYYEAIILADGASVQTTQLNKWVNGQRTTLVSDPIPWISGDKIRIICIGNIIKVMKNGALLGDKWSYVDEQPILTGSPGITATNYMFGDDWTAFTYLAATVLLDFDPETPEQISFRCPVSGTLPTGASATVEYKADTATDWIAGGSLYRVQPANFVPTLLEGLSGRAIDSFVGWITGLQPGVAYNVKVTVSRLGFADQVIQGVRSTRALPAPAPAITHNCGKETFAAVVKTLKAGDHLRLAPGDYPLTGPLTSVPSGSRSQPIYISAAELGTVTFVRIQGTALAPNSDHVVWERIRFTGSGTDAGLATNKSEFCLPVNTRRCRAWTFRFCEILGFDTGIKCFTPVDDFLVYECLFRGNNTWDKTYLINPLNNNQPNHTWDDSALQFPGSGNAAWNNTISGFGDAFRCDTSNRPQFSGGNYYWRNRVEWTGDNAFEADQCSGNVAVYDNLLMNCGDMVSADITFGPIGFFRNICINTTRGPIKLTAASINTRILNNTFVIGTKVPTSDPSNGLLTPSAVMQIGLQYQNNLFVYSGPGNIIHWSSPMSGETWGNNAWTDGAIYFNELGTYSSVAAAAAPAGIPVRFAKDVVVPAQPFAQAITLGPDYSTVFLGSPTGALAVGSPARGAGAVLPGVTDGHSGGAPDIGAHITGRVPVTYGRSTAPAWLTSAAVGVWGEVPARNRCVDEDPAADLVLNPGRPSPPPWEGSGGWARIMVAWCGACFDSRGGVLHMNAAGGHSDYFGNSSVRLDLNKEIPFWKRYSNPSVVPTYVGLEATGVYSDGKPRSAHTYNGQVYVPGLGPVLVSQQAMTYSGGHGPAKPVSWDENTGLATFWESFGGTATSGVAACWDSDRQCVIYKQQGTSPVREWRRQNSPQHTAPGPNVVWDGGVSMCHMTGLGAVLFGNGDDSTTVSNGPIVQSVTGGWAVYNTATGEMKTPTFVGAATSVKQLSLGVLPGQAQPMWDAARRCAYVWDNRTNTTQVIKLTPGANVFTDPWTCTLIQLSGIDGQVPTPAQNKGTFGRAWFWHNCLFVVNAVDQPVYFVKLG